MVRNVFLLWLVSCSAFVSNAQTFEQVYYTSVDDVIGNPERGFYHQVNTISSESLQDFKSDGVRLVLVNYSLKGFHNKPLPTDFLSNLETDFEKIRAAGFKIILRFSYSFSMSDPVPDATLDYVLLHIDQLEDILQRNSDVILTLQAGFIGTWGEWWNTENFSMSPGYITEENWVDRRMVVDALLNAIPEDRMVQLRTPVYKKELLQEDSYIPVATESAYDNSPGSRLAHHNDCFVSGNFDVGTYHDTLVEKPYLAIDSRYTIVGGETCNPNVESSCTNSLKELSRFHWTFLNLDYHQGILAQWRNEGCYDEIERKLGYRFELIDANLQNEGKPGGEIQLTVKIKNTGWTNPTNPYAPEMILRNNTTGEDYVLSIDEDIRKWSLSENVELNITAGLPETMTTGDYQLFFVVKDGRLSLGFNPDYCIRFANSDTWEPTSGYNSLLHTVSVINDEALPDYAGEDFFTLKGAVTPGFEGPKALKITQYNDNNIIYWSMGAMGDEEKVVRLQRAVDGGAYQTLAIKPLYEISYVDAGLQDDATYSYQVQYIQNDEYSEIINRNIEKQNPDTRQFVDIETDGQEEDWNIVRPVTTGYQGGMAALKLSNDIENLYFYIEAPEINSYELLLNTDDDSQYLLRNDSLFEPDNSQWIFKQTVEVSSSDGFREGRVALSGIDFQNAGLTGQFHLNDELIGDATQPFPYLKNKVLNSPANFKVVPSVTTPLSKVKISWLYNSNVEGYIIERSIGDHEHYEVIRDLAGSNNYYLNNNLDSTTTYYYRMFAYSGIVRSDYTADFSIKLNDYNAVEEEMRALNNIQIRPNPVVDKFALSIDTDKNLRLKIGLYDSNLRFISSLYEGRINHEKSIYLRGNGLESGLYFIRIQSEHSTIIKKIIVL